MTDDQKTDPPENVEPVEDSLSGEHRDKGADAPAVHGTSDDTDEFPESVSAAFEAMTDGPDGVDDAAPIQYGVGPFSVREVALGGVALLAFIVSFFPVVGAIGSGPSVWTSGIDWILMIGAPVLAVFLIGLRRLSPQGIRRVGSLGIDQFASVVFSVAALSWLSMLWNSFVIVYGDRLSLATWVVWVEFILMLAGVLLTVFAPLFPVVGEDFRHRSEVPAHRLASPARPVVPRPRTPRPAPAQTPATETHTFATQAPPTQTPADADDVAPFGVTAQEQQPAAPTSQAFWALAPAERDVVDADGAPIFTIGPTAWALVIEDRGESFVVRHEDGRIGFLHDISGVTRG